MEKRNEPQINADLFTVLIDSLMANHPSYSRKEMDKTNSWKQKKCTNVNIVYRKF